MGNDFLELILATGFRHIVTPASDSRAITLRISLYNGDDDGDRNSRS